MTIEAHTPAAAAMDVKPAAPVKHPSIESIKHEEANPGAPNPPASDKVITNGNGIHVPAPSAPVTVGKETTGILGKDRPELDNSSDKPIHIIVHNTDKSPDASAKPVKPSSTGDRLGHGPADLPKPDATADVGKPNARVADVEAPKAADLAKMVSNIPKSAEALTDPSLNTPNEPANLDQAAPPSVTIAQPADSVSMAVNGDGKETISTPSKPAQPPADGVHFGGVEIVAPSKPPVEEPEVDTAMLEDDLKDQDYKVEDDIDVDEEDKEAEDDIQMDDVHDGDASKDKDTVENASNMLIPELQPGVLKALLASSPQKDLHVAASEGSLDKVRELLSEGGEMQGSVDERDVFRYTPLHVAAENGHVKVCEFLLDLNADVNASTKMHSCTSLHYAAFNGHEAVVTLLLERGAELNALTDDNRTALYQAAMKDHIGCVDVLLKHGADADIKDANDKSPADVTSKEEIKTLLADVPVTKRRKIGNVAS